MSKYFFETFTINIAGLINIETHNKLNPYVPIIDVMLNISGKLIKL